MLFAQLPDDLVLLVEPHGAGAVLGCHKEDTGMGMCGGKGQIQMPFNRLAYPFYSYGQLPGVPRQLVQFEDHKNSTRDTAQYIKDGN